VATEKLQISYLPLKYKSLNHIKSFSLYLVENTLHLVYKKKINAVE